MDTKKITIGALLAIAAVFGVMAFKAPTTVTVPQLGDNKPVVNVEAAKVNVPAPIVNVNVPKQNLGAMAGPDVFFRSSFHKGLTTGGYTATTSTAATYTTAAADFAELPGVIFWTPNINTTVSLSSTSTLPYVPNIGDVANIYIRNASSTAAASITFAAASTNADLQFAEATGGDLVLTGLDWEKVTIIRTGTYNVTFIMDEMTEAD